MIQVLIGNTNEIPISRVQQWLNPLSNGSFNTYAPQGRVPCSAAGTFKNLKIQTSPAPSTSIQYAIEKNSVTTALSVTLNGSATTGRDTADTVSVVAGDVLSLTLLPGGSCVMPTQFQWSLEFDSTTTGQSIYAVGGATLAVSSPRGRGLLMWDDGWQAQSAPAQINLIATAGVIGRYDILLDTGFGGSGTVTFTIYKNGVAQDGTGGTPNTQTVMTGATTSATWTGTLNVAPADYVQMVGSWTGSLATAYICQGVLFTAAVDGLWLICGAQAGSNMSASATEYSVPNATDQGGFNTWTNTEAASNTIAGVQTITLQNFYVRISGISGSAGQGKGYIFTPRKNNASLPMTVTLTDTQLTGNVFGSSTVADGDVWALQEAPFNTPQNRYADWTFTAFVSGPTPPSAPVYNVRRLRQFTIPGSENFWLFLRKLEFEVQRGVGLTTGQGSNPQLMFQLSRDGGQTFGPEIWVTPGAIGDYTHRAIIRRLGRARNPVGRITVSDPVFWALLDCYFEGDLGTS